LQAPYNGSAPLRALPLHTPMADTSPIDQIADRVERLLLRHEELQRTNALLLQQVQSLQAERDLMKSRLQAARSRIDALLERLPANADTSSPQP
jgi:cell division protein ZapB